MSDIDIWVVVVLCFGFTVAATFAATGAVATASFIWMEYQRNKIMTQLEHVRSESQRVQRELQSEYNWLKKDHEKLLAEYMTLSALVRGGDGPEVSINAKGNLHIGEFVGKDRSE